MPKVPKIRSSHIFAIFLEKHGDEFDFLPEDKYEGFVEVVSITLYIKKSTIWHYRF